MKTGKIIQVMGPVVDVEFEDEELPAIRDALEVQNGDKKCIMEVAQHIGNNTVRCIMLAASEGLHRDIAILLISSWINTVFPTPAPPNRPILPPFAYGASKSMTLIPVSKISSAGF